MGNQASEDKLDEILTRFADGEYSKHWVDERNTYTKLEAKTAIQDLIRNEKLKLLAAVRERVVCEDETDDLTAENTKPVHDEWAFRNPLRAEQRIELTKLEAEL